MQIYSSFLLTSDLAQVVVRLVDWLCRARQERRGACFPNKSAFPYATLNRYSASVLRRFGSTLISSPSS